MARGSDRAKAEGRLRAGFSPIAALLFGVRVTHRHRKLCGSTSIATQAPRNHRGSRRLPGGAEGIRTCDPRHCGHQRAFDGGAASDGAWRFCSFAPVPAPALSPDARTDRRLRPQRRWPRRVQNVDDQRSLQYFRACSRNWKPSCAATAAVAQLLDVHVTPKTP
jgi:hypothetical protein